MRRPKERITITINVPAEKREVLDNFDKLVRQENGKSHGGRSRWMLKAMEEFYRNHWPRNPQRSLLVSLPKPIRNQKLERRNITIIHLRFTSHLTYMQIAEVIEESYGPVRRRCKRVIEQSQGVYKDFDGRKRPRIMSKNFKRQLQLYRERYRKYLRGEFNTVDEAFRFARA